jgi:uncharacterized protein YeaO (DUF488 family)
MVKIKRVYDPRESSDGTRILVMRLWPRGIRREQVDEWNRDVAPSVGLLRAFKRGGLPWERYVQGYWKEIAPEAVDALRRRARRGTITLLCGCPDENHCHRGLLRDAIEKKRSSPQRHKGKRRVLGGPQER